MLSIVICSVLPERLLQISQNIHDTIGVEYEIIAIDNKEKKWPIARAYNEGACQARYPFLRIAGLLVLPVAKSNSIVILVGCKIKIGLVLFSIRAGGQELSFRLHVLLWNILLRKL